MTFFKKLVLNIGSKYALLHVSVFKDFVYLGFIQLRNTSLLNPNSYAQRIHLLVALANNNYAIYILKILPTDFPALKIILIQLPSIQLPLNLICFVKTVI